MNWVNLFDISKLETELKELEKQTVEVNFWSDSKKSSVVLGKIKKIKSKVETYKKIEKEPENIIITRFDIERIPLILTKEDNISRIYINFCNPWPKGKHHKKRLTHTRQLEKYKEFLAKDGKIYFKTDDKDLYLASLRYLEESGFEIINKTEDLHNNPIFTENILTEHEKMFTEQGITTKALIAKLTC